MPVDWASAKAAEFAHGSRNSQGERSTVAEGSWENVICRATDVASVNGRCSCLFQKPLGRGWTLFRATRVLVSSVPLWLSQAASPWSRAPRAALVELRQGEGRLRWGLWADGVPLPQTEKPGRVCKLCASLLLPPCQRLLLSHTPGWLKLLLALFCQRAKQG